MMMIIIVSDQQQPQAGPRSRRRVRVASRLGQTIPAENPAAALAGPAASELQRRSGALGLESAASRDRLGVFNINTAVIAT